MADAIRDRKDAEEARYKLNEERAFKIRARRTKLLGLWAAERMGLQGEPAQVYAAALVGASLDLPNDAALVTHVVSDLAGRAKPADPAEVRGALDAMQAEATRQIMAAHPTALDTDHRKVGD